MTFPEFVYACFLVIGWLIVTGDLLVKPFQLIAKIFKIE